MDNYNHFDNFDFSERLEELIVYAVHGGASRSELEELDELLAVDPVYRDVHSKLSKEERRRKLIGDFRFTINSEEQVYHTFLNWAGIDPLPHVQPVKEKKGIFKQVSVFSLATIILGIIGTYILYKTGLDSWKVTPTVIAAGSNKATLTLADGSSINLDDAKNGVLTKQGDVALEKTGDSTLAYVGNNEKSVGTNTLTVPKGGQYHIILPDGSGVWLNASSAISYPTAFSGTSREVTLNGEAYFEITKDKTKPFIVHVASNKTNVTVLATHFNIMAYTDDNKSVEATLLEGAIQLAHGASTQLLKPNQQAKVTEAGAISVTEMKDANQSIDWRNGVFQLDDQSLSRIAQEISRWYDVKIVYDHCTPGQLSEHLATGVIPRNMNLEDVLKVLELDGIHTDLDEEERTLTVMCKK
jgi:ferric-dicitrate binding protein FerR (iron transport regulator)